MKQQRCPMSPLLTVRVRRSSAQAYQTRRVLYLKRAGERQEQGPQVKSQAGRDVMCRLPPTIVIQRQEMSSYFRLFDDDQIQDFLWMDCCCRLADKYLLAMVFVYFKRSCFAIAEYTKRNFFIALYLANTMEEDEGESKYEIFPWALGKSWRKRFPSFLRQKDQFWARLNYRAAVSRRCCEEVMAIVPAHFLWKRERSEEHSGAQRLYGSTNQIRMPRGPAASPLPCDICTRHANSKSRHGFPPVHGGSSPAQVQNPAHPAVLHPQLSLEKTPPRRKPRHSSCCFLEETPRDESLCGSTRDSSMDWISEE